MSQNSWYVIEYIYGFTLFVTMWHKMPKKFIWTTYGLNINPTTISKEFNVSYRRAWSRIKKAMRHIIGTSDEIRMNRLPCDTENLNSCKGANFVINSEPGACCLWQLPVPLIKKTLASYFTCYSVYAVSWERNVSTLGFSCLHHYIPFIRHINTTFINFFQQKKQNYFKPRFVLVV